MSRWVVVGTPEGRRTALFQEALAEAGRPPATLIPWADLLDGRARLDAVLQPGDRLRIDSPDRDFGVERRLLALGASTDSPPDGYAGIDAMAARALPEEKGRIRYPRQWYRGLRAALHRIANQIAAAPRVSLLNDPDEIAVLFDKPACHTALAVAGIPVPRSLGIPENFADLTARMAVNGVRSIFLKLAHGSSASGIVAYRQDSHRDRHQALTTVEQVAAGDGGEPILYNTRAIRRLEDVEEIGRLVDALCRHRAHTEVWLPKASLPDLGAFDVRALVIAGRPRHVVARCSRSPMTNLHLLNDRASAEVVRARVGPSAWASLKAMATRAAALFPRSLQIGLDICWTPGFRHPYVLEANAFGDLLPGALSEGESTYLAEIRAVEGPEPDFRPPPPIGSVSTC